ncbi:MAG: amidase [Candidatus Binatia bacterium]
MALRAPNADELRRLAAANHFALDAEEAADYAALIPLMLSGLDALAATPREAPTDRTGRDTGGRPAPADDPLNAIVRRCSVRGAATGKLAGKRIGVKDNIAIAGIPMTCGSRLLEGYVPERDATIITRVLNAGAEIVAVTNMDNMAFAAAGDTSAYGPTLNPHNRDHLAGGSSGGSAAALCYEGIDLALGGDQGGSIRVPSAWCGTVGIKPTHGLVPYTGIVGIDATIDHAGPMARTVSDAALLLDVIAGKDPADPRQGEVPTAPYRDALDRGVRGLRIGVLREGFGLDGAEADVDAAVRAALDGLAAAGAKIEPVSVPAHREAGPIFSGIVAEGMTALLQGNGVGYHWPGQYDEELAAFLGTQRRARGDELPAPLKVTLLVGTWVQEQYPGLLYPRAQNRRRDLRAAYDRALEQCDLLAMPTTPMKAYRNASGLTRRARVIRGWAHQGNTSPFDVTGHPAISVPCGRSGGLPIGLMLVGRHFDEVGVLRAAAAVERAQRDGGTAVDDR